MLLVKSRSSSQGEDKSRARKNEHHTIESASVMLTSGKSVATMRSFCALRAFAIAAATMPIPEPSSIIVRGEGEPGNGGSNS